jgi:CubicO group peptidase (beta-lactamase class C family)
MLKRVKFTAVMILAALAMSYGSSCDRQDDSIATPEPLSNGDTDTALIDTAYLDTLVSEINKGTYGNVRSVLIQRKGVLVFERYFRGYNRETKHHLYSVTKSVTSALIGIAIDRGEIDDVDRDMLSFFPGYPGIANLDSLKESITLEHLLTMTAGLEWDEWDVPYDDPDNDIAAMYVSNDWVEYVLDLPMTDVPGERFVYNSGVSMLLSAIVTNVSGRSASAYAAEHLFGHIGITSWTWTPAPSNPGMSIGGWGLHLRPIDLVKFGQLFLEEGRWGDRQIVSESWVEASTRPHAVISDLTEYGYQWWMYSDSVIDDGYIDINDIFIGVGRGNQYLWVVPHYDLVVVSTAWNDNNGKHSSPMFFRYIIPAVRSVVESEAPLPAVGSPPVIGR